MKILVLSNLQFLTLNVDTIVITAIIVLHKSLLLYLLLFY